MTDLDRQAAEFEALRAKRLARPLMSSPTNSARPKFIPGAAIAASKAALEARADLAKANRDLAETKARLATAQADLANRARVALPAKATPAAAAPAPRPLADVSDSQLQFIAGHRSASETDRAAAKAALESRGWTCHANGNFSMSTTKKARR